MTASRFAISRRAALRGLIGGAAVALGLPPLEAMFDANGEAYADGSAIPTRLGVWFWGNGVRPEHWVPSQTGAIWTPKAETAPLAALNDGPTKYVSIVGGYGCPVKGSAHHTGRAQVLTGTYDPNKGTYGNPTGASIDTIAADYWDQDPATKPLIKHLALGISRHGKSTSTSNGHTTIDNSGSAVSAEFSPRELFDRLFVQADPTDPLAQAHQVMRKSVLDAVMQDAAALKKRLGNVDQLRLEEHLQGIVELEAFLDAKGFTCQAPTQPQNYPYDPSHESLVEVNQAMAKVLALGLACNMTRSFSYQFTQMQADTLFWMDPINATEGSHVMTHDDRNIPESQKKAPQLEKVHLSVVFMMEQFAVLLKELRSIPEGAGTVLDNCVIQGCSEVNDGTKHDTNDMPMVIAGRGGGKLKAGLHHRGNGEPVSQVLLTCLRAAGVEKSTLGAGALQTSQSISALMA